MTNPRDVVSAERLIHAPAAAIFDVIADPARHPEIDGSGTVLKARPGSSSRLSAGATFGMDMKLGVRYGMVSTVTEFDEGRLIAWSPKPASGRRARFIGRIWRYELEPVEDGTREGFRFFLRYANASRPSGTWRSRLSAWTNWSLPAPERAWSTLAYPLMPSIYS